MCDTDLKINPNFYNPKFVCIWRSINERLASNAEQGGIFTH